MGSPPSTQAGGCRLVLRTIVYGWRLIALLLNLRRYQALAVFVDYVPPGPVGWILTWAFGRGARSGRPGERLAKALQALGPTFVKFGQSLATRADLIGEESARDLERLQDRLPPFAAKLARATIERELGRTIDELFTQFDDEPVAAASIAQVHKATIITGEIRAVKVLRPGIEQAIERDLLFFIWLAAQVEWLLPSLRRFKPCATVAVFAQATRRELDLRLEAAAASELNANCRDDDGFRVPQVDWERTGRRVVVFEFIDGLPVSDRQGLIEAGHDPSAIMQAAARVFFNQVFRDGFFHGDMHPGNMLIDAQGRIVALDFGIMGRVSLDDRRHLAEILVGFLMGDYGRVADSFHRAGFLVRLDERDAFMQACRSVGEPIQGLPLEAISFGKLLGQVLTLAQQFDILMQPQLLVLQKTIVVAEGVGRLLDPRINMWVTARPLVDRWIRDHLGPKAQLERLAVELGDAAIALPRLIAALETRLRQDATITTNKTGNKNRLFWWALLTGLSVALLFWLLTTYFGKQI